MPTNAEIERVHPQLEHARSLQTDKTTGRFYRLPVEGEWLGATPELKAEFDRIDALSEEEMLAEYGYGSEERYEGLMVRRTSSGMLDDAFGPGEGDGFFYYRVVVGEDERPTLVKVPNHTISHPSVVPGMPAEVEPVFDWPREGVRMVYGHALKQRARQVAEQEAATAADGAKSKRG